MTLHSTVKLISAVALGNAERAGFTVLAEAEKATSDASTDKIIQHFCERYKGSTYGVLTNKELLSIGASVAFVVEPKGEQVVINFFNYYPGRKGLDNTHTLTCDGAWDPESGRRTAQHAILESLLSTVECLLRLPPVVKHVEIEHEA